MSTSGPTLYLATPIAAEATCMQCHSVPSAAPAAMIAKYGSKHGFGWKQGSVVAAQIVSVPMSLPVQIANQAFHRLLLYLIVAMVATMIALDIGVYYIVIRPLKTGFEHSRPRQQRREGRASVGGERTRRDRQRYRLVQPYASKPGKGP